MLRHAQLTHRRGFTLIEMLVVMGIMLLLAAIAAGVGYSGMIGSQRTVSSADRVSGWLILAKQRALRDLRPHGVRFIGKNQGSYISVTEAQYIETPEPWVPSDQARLVIVRPVTNPYNEGSNAPALRLYFASTNPNDITELEQRVREGDRIILHGLLELNYQIAGDNPVEVVNPVGDDPMFNSAVPPYRFASLPISNASATDLSQRLGAAFSPDEGSGTTPPTVNQSAIVLQVGLGFQALPQPVLGEPVLQLTDPMMIDVRATATLQPIVASTTTTTIGVTPVLNGDGSYTFDVLFKPSGSVLGGTGGLICLWLRDQNTLRDNVSDAASPRDAGNYDLTGEQLLVVISTRTGLISTQPVNDDATNPYLFAQDGKNNGV